MGDSCRRRGPARGAMVVIAVLGCLARPGDEAPEPAVAEASEQTATASAEPPPEPTPPPAEDAIDPDERAAPPTDEAPEADTKLVPEPAVAWLPRPRWVRHRRAPRERLEQIAARYGVTPEDVREWNDLPADDVPLRRNARLRIKARRVPPPRRALEYAVQPGDTWSAVARAHGIASGDLRAYNWPYRGKMSPGHTLKVWIDPVVYDWISAAEGDAEIRRGAVSVGPPDSGWLVNGVQIPEGDGWRRRLPRSAYGTTHAVEQVTAALSTFASRSGYPGSIELGAMSRPGGGPIGDHRSHQTGRDLDVRLPRREGVAHWVELTRRRVDWRATWQLVQAFAETDVIVIFLDYGAQRWLHRAAREAGASAETRARLLQYPRGSAASRGLVRHADGHDRHLHVRFGCGPHEPECMP